PEMAGPVRARIRFPRDEVIPSPGAQRLSDCIGGTRACTKVQFDYFEILVVDGADVGIFAEMLLTLLVGVDEIIQAGPLPRVGAVGQIVTRDVEFLGQIPMAARSDLGAQQIYQLRTRRPAMIQGVGLPRSCYQCEQAYCESGEAVGVQLSS